MNDNSSITHVADTAVWVAHYRALETERPDALFHDTLAGVLAGDRGRNIAARMPYPKMMEWALVIRTVAIDALIETAIDLGIDTVVNLGAGLDTRPYRMRLPADLRWIEVDFPDMIAYKTEKLKGQRAICHLERVPVDLSDIPKRQELFERIGSEAHKALVITEGVILYLSPDDVSSLSRDLFAVPAFQYWIQDFYLRLRQVPRKMRENLKQSPFKFFVPDWFAFFQERGWTIFEKRLAADEAERVRRPFPVMFPWSLIMMALPRKVQERWRNSSGYVMYQKPLLVA